MTTQYYDLDFEDIKANLKEFFESSTEFTDYNFEGSAASGLLDVLSYNTQTHAFYLNQSVNDLTLQNAEIDSNIKKLSHMLSYLPSRKSSPYISVSLQRNDTYTIIIPKYSTWNMGSLLLTNIEDITISDGSVYVVDLYEGIPTTETFTSDGTSFQRFTLSNTSNVDNDYFDVYVDASDGSGGWIESTTPWKSVNNDDFEFEEDCYYIEYFEDFTVKFDDGQLFTVPPDGDRIRIEYVYTNGITYNGTTGTITITDEDATNIEYLDISTSDSLSNGVDEEENEGIKSRAPLFYTTQGRAVTEGDYNNLIKRWSDYDTLDSAIAWGGEKEYIDTGDDDHIIETGSTKDLGYVYFSMLKSDLDYLSSGEWSDIEDFLSIYKYINLFFKFLHPVFFNISPTVNVSYQSLVGITEDIEDLTNVYLDTLEGYNKSFYLSDLIGFVDDLQTVVYTYITYTTNVTVRHSADDYNVIRLNSAVDTSSISGTINGNAISDDGAGNIEWNSGTVGSINYTTGFIVLDTSFGGLSEGDTYDIGFDLTDQTNITLEKESYLKFNDITLNLV